MNRQPLTLLDALWGSWGSKEFYRAAPHVPLRIVIGVYLISLLLVTTASFLASRAELYAAYDRFYERHGQYVPTLEIGDDGIARATSGQEPMIAVLNDAVPEPGRKFMLVIDTTGSTSALSADAVGILATSDTVVYRDWSGEHRLSWPNARGLLSMLLGATTVSPEALAEGRDRFVTVMATASGLLSLCGAAALSGLMIGMYSLTTLMVARSRGLLISAGESMRICVFALFPPALVYLLLSGIDPGLSHQALFLICLTLFSLLVLRGINPSAN